VLRCGNIILLTVKFLDVANFITLAPLSLLISCKPSFPIFGLRMSSLPNLALKSYNKIFMWYLGNLPNTRSVTQHRQGVTLTRCGVDQCDVTLRGSDSPNVRRNMWLYCLLLLILFLKGRRNDGNQRSLEPSTMLIFLSTS
jgi:hypothetical protein